MTRASLFPIIYNLAAFDFVHENFALDSGFQWQDIHRYYAGNITSFPAIFHCQRKVFLIAILKYGDIQIVRIIRIHEGAKNDNPAYFPFRLQEADQPLLQGFFFLLSKHNFTQNTISISNRDSFRQQKLLSHHLNLSSRTINMLEKSFSKIHFLPYER